MLALQYLPHCPIIKENGTTRYRTVFDAQARGKVSHTSFNDCLESGINIIELIATMLHRFRLERICVITHIPKSCFWIIISPSNNNYYDFCGLEKTVSWCTIDSAIWCLGVTCNTFLLCIVIQYQPQNVLKRHNDEYPENIKLFSNSLTYWVTSVRNEKELEQFIKVATTFIGKRKF